MLAPICTKASPLPLFLFGVGGDLPDARGALDRQGRRLAMNLEDQRDDPLCRSLLFEAVAETKVGAFNGLAIGMSAFRRMSCASSSIDPPMRRGVNSRSRLQRLLESFES